MRRLEQLIHDVEFHSDEDSTRFNAMKYNKIFKDAQNEVQRIIVTSNPDGRFFPKDKSLDLVGEQEAYNFPSDVYSKNSVHTIAISSQFSDQDNSMTPLRKITERERSKAWGYIPFGDTFLISPKPSQGRTNGLRVTYERKLPDPSTRIGQVDTYSSPNITLLAGFFADEDITLFDDYICLVDADGVIETDADGEFLNTAIKVLSYNTTTGVIVLETPAQIDGASPVGKYVVSGKYATTHMQLMEEAEKYITDFVTRKIHAINSSGDVQDSQIFTEDEKKNLIDLFSKVDLDVPYPPITDSSYLNF